MRKLFIVGLFLLGLIAAVVNFPGLANQGSFDSLVLDFREDKLSQLDSQLQTLSREFQLTPRLNSEFSQADHVYVVKGDRAVLEQLRRSQLRQYTEFIEPNYIYRALQLPNDPDYAKQWNFRSINVESAWDQTKGSGVTVAVIDTGVSQVPDLNKTKFVKGYDFVNDRADASDDNGHGTHVAGTIAQSTNNNYGVAGIAYEASIMPLKVLSGSGGGEIADIAEAIKFAADNGATVINLSLGGAGESQLLKEATEYAYKKGVAVIAAAGNEGRNSAIYPARYPHVLGVSAIGPSAEKASYSNYGAGVDIAAPGGEIVEESGSGGILQNTIDPETGEPTFAAYQGTSMASPHVAGVAALLQSVGVKEPDQVYEVLKQSARQIQDDGLNYYGAGQLDAAAAVQLAGRGRIDLNDFFRWLRDNGYLNPRFWIDGGIPALMPKLLMMLGSYLLAIALRYLFGAGWPWPIAWPWSWPLSFGLVAGSSGLFFLRGFYIFDLPQWPFRVLGSSVAEWGGAIQGSSVLNPIFASVLIPVLLVVFLLNHPQGRWVAIGTALGMCSYLAASAMIGAPVLWLGSGAIARGYLIINSLLCFGLAYLATKAAANGGEGVGG